MGRGRSSEEPCLLLLLRGNGSAGGESESVLDLACSLASNAAWSDLPPAELVVRERPRPLLGVVGTFAPSDRERLAILGDQLGRERPRRIEYEAVERECEALAEVLSERFGRSAVADFAYIGLPRGGLIVLGMLSYALRLAHARLEPPHPPGRPLVVVDDIALTGSRFGRFLKRCGSREIVFAPLFSPVGLRLAIVEREPAVIACVSARDLDDRTSEVLGAESAVWRTRMMSRLDPPRYWIGKTDAIGFPWSEPDSGSWNDATGRVEAAWRLSPARASLRQRVDGAGRTIPVQVNEPGPGPIRASPPVIFARQHRRMLIADTDAGGTWTLDDIGADLWSAVLDTGSRDGAIDRLTAIYDAPRHVLERDADSLLHQLRTWRLLVDDHDTS